LALRRTKDRKVVNFIVKKIRNAQEEEMSYDDENSTDVRTFQRERSLASSDDNSFSDEGTSGFEPFPIEQWQRSVSLSPSCNLHTHISQIDRDSSANSESQVFEHSLIFNGPGSHNMGSSRPRSLSFGSSRELRCSPSPPAFPHHPSESARHSILVVVCLAILLLTSKLWQEPEDILKANGILEISQFGNDARVIVDIEEGKQDSPIEAPNRLSESNAISIVDRNCETPGTAQLSEEEKATRSKREGPSVMHFLNSGDEPQFLRMSTTLTPTSTQPHLLSLNLYSSDQVEHSSPEGAVAQPQDIGLTAWELCYAQLRGQWF